MNAGLPAFRMGSLFSSFHDQLSASQGTEPGGIDCHRAQKVALRLLVGAAADVQPLDGVILGTTLQIAQPQQVGAERVFLLVIFDRPLDGQPPACVGRAGRPLAGAVAPQGELGLFPLFLCHPRSPPAAAEKAEVPLRRRQLQQRGEGVCLADLEIRFSGELVLQCGGADAKHLCHMVHLQLPVPNVVFDLCAICHAYSPFCFPQDSRFTIFSCII